MRNKSATASMLPPAQPERHHHPPHIHVDDSWYSISAATIGHQPYLSGLAAKAAVRDELRALTRRFGMHLKAWVVLDDHYHLLVRVGLGQDLTRFCAQLHGSTSRQVNLLAAKQGRRVWDNYWDSCVRAEMDFWTRFNYVHWNPVKHGYVAQPEDWEFSSYRYYLRTKGEEWLADCLGRYPVVETDPEKG